MADPAETSIFKAAGYVVVGVVCMALAAVAIARDEVVATRENRTAGGYRQQWLATVKRTEDPLTFYGEVGGALATSAYLFYAAVAGAKRT